MLHFLETTRSALPFTITFGGGGGKSEARVSGSGSGSGGGVSGSFLSGHNRNIKSLIKLNCTVRERRVVRPPNVQDNSSIKSSSSGTQKLRNGSLELLC